MTEGQARVAEAVAFLMRYRGTFVFLTDMKNCIADPSYQLTVKQVEAVLRCKEREQNKQQQQNGQDLELGIYSVPTNGGEPDIVKVKLTRDKRRKYAVVLRQIGGRRLDAEGKYVRWDWSYAASYIARLKPEMRMDEEQAKQFGIKYGICANCGRQLKDAKSVAAGIGPVCIKHFRF